MAVVVVVVVGLRILIRVHGICVLELLLLLMLVLVVRPVVRVREAAGGVAAVNAVAASPHANVQAARHPHDVAGGCRRCRCRAC